MHEVYVFCSEQGRKLERQLLFCFELDIPIFCGGARLSQRARIQEISSWGDLEEGILVGICPIKQCFLL